MVMKMEEKQVKSISAEEEQPYAYWLAAVTGLGNQTRKDLIEYAGSAEAVYEMKEIQFKEFLPEKKRKLLFANRKEWGEPEKKYKELKEKEIAFYPISHPHYPKRLRNIGDAPYGIFVEGRLPEEEKPAVAVIGARQCSEYGRFMAQLCGRQLAEAGVNVISGMARGIDGISQNAALKAGGMSYAVLGCGTNVCYPAENRHIYVSVKKNGGVISEYLPGTLPKPGLFPPRNRIISGLADVVVIVEARNKSGTLITADMALEQGREVYVIPGRMTDPLSEGCNRLLKQGAGLLLSVTEMLEETGIAVEKHRCNQKDSGKGEQAESRTEEQIMRGLDFYPKSVENLKNETGIEYRQLVFGLVQLCMKGKAQQVSPGQYIRKRL